MDGQLDPERLQLLQVANQQGLRLDRVLLWVHAQADLCPGVRHDGVDRVVDLSGLRTAIVYDSPRRNGMAAGGTRS